jgi:quercetin dioxygenase-like cupin family protein
MASKHYFNWDQFPEVEAMPGIFRRVMCGEKVMLSLVRAKAGAKVVNHWHDAEQVSWIMKGSMRVTTDRGEEKIIGPGDIWVIPANAVHSAEYLEDTEMLEGFSPIRLEYLIGYTPDSTVYEK